MTQANTGGGVGVGGRTVMAVGGGSELTLGEPAQPPGDSFVPAPQVREKQPLISWLQKLVPLGADTSQ